MAANKNSRSAWRYLPALFALVLLGVSLGVGLSSGHTAYAYSPGVADLPLSRADSFGSIQPSVPLTTATATATYTNTPTPLPPTPPSPPPPTRTFTGTSTFTPSPTLSPTYTPSPTFTGTPTVVCTPGGPYVYATVTGPPYVVATTDTGNHCDNCATTVSLPFQVRFFQFQSFTSAIVGSNGILAFTANGNPAANTCLPDLTSNNAIFAMWDDLRTDGAGGAAGIYTLLSGSAPNRSFVIEWRACLNMGAPCTSVDANFEIIFHELSDTFEIQYGNVANNGATASIGTQRSTSGSITRFSCDAASLRSGLVTVWRPLGCGEPFPTFTPTFTPTPIFTYTPTYTPTAAPVLVGHVFWQGAPTQPDPRQIQPITLTLKMGTVEVNYPVTNTDGSGIFAQNVSGLPAGTWDWRVKGPRSLANCGTLSLPPASTVQMGVMRTGDATNDNIVDAQDFNVLRNTFGLACDNTGFDPSADFTNDCVVNVSDFNWVRQNYSSVGCLPE